MPRALRITLLSLRDLLVSAGPLVLLTLALLTLAYWWLDPNPPRRVTLATGPAQSAYAEFGQRYRKVGHAHRQRGRLCRQVDELPQALQKQQSQRHHDAAGQEPAPHAHKRCICGRR